jgi:glycoprotein-N-acetylgalactosamine 3-beta-galactosyltransferase
VAEQGNTKPGGNAYSTRNAWAKRCTGFVAFSNHVDVAFPTINLQHDGPEEYNNMWQKSREIWKFIYRNYRDQFDFFVLGGDDMFYIMESLGGYLMSSEVREEVENGRGVFLGRRFYPAQPLVFNSGGAGYTLDRVSLDALYNVLDKPVCFAHQHTFAEDVNVARCLRYSAIYPHDTRDESKAGGVVFEYLLSSAPLPS